MRNTAGSSDKFFRLAGSKWTSEVRQMASCKRSDPMHELTARYVLMLEANLPPEAMHDGLGQSGVVF